MRQEKGKKNLLAISYIINKLILTTRLFETYYFQKKAITTNYVLVQDAEGQRMYSVKAKGLGRVPLPHTSK